MNTKIQAVVAAIKQNNMQVFNEHTRSLRTVTAVGMVGEFVVALYDHSYFTLSQIVINDEGVPCIKVGSVAGGVLTISGNINTLDKAIAEYNNLDNYAAWYQPQHVQITEVTYIA